VQLLDVADHHSGVLNEHVGVSDAGSELIEVVVAGEAEDQARNEVRDGVQRKGEGRKAIFDRLNRADEASDDVGGIITSREVVLGGPVLILLGDVLLDGGAVEEPVLADGLAELGGLFEDLSPGLDSGDVVVHASAASDGVWELPNDITEVLDGGDGVEALDVRDGLLALLDEVVGVVEADTQLIELVVTSEAEDEASDEVGDGVKRERQVRKAFHGALDGADSEDHEVSEIVAGLVE